MPSLVSSITAVATISRVGSFAGLLVALVAAPVVAQSPLSHLDDAAPVPAGILRFRLANVWTRFDQRFGETGGLVPLGAALSTDSLGSAQLPRLIPIEAGLRTLVQDPLLRLSLGRLQVTSNARTVTTPISLEYGVTRRLSVGVIVPIVQTRRVAQAIVSGDSTRANVGYVAASSRPGAAASNRLVAVAFQRSADSLGVLLARCPANPSAAGCAAVNANTADATSARDRARSFAAAVRALGVDAENTIVAPRASSELADALDARRIQLNQRLQQYLGANAGAATGIFTAPTDFSYFDLQGNRALASPGLLKGPIGGGLDSIRTTERFGLGDIAIGAQYLVFDRFQRDSARPPRVQSRLAVAASVRLPTSRPDSAQSLLDIATGDGAGVTVRTAWDVIVGRLGGTVAARYAKSFGRTVQASLYGDPEAAFPYPLFVERKRTAGDVLGIDVTPRFLVSESLALDAHYGLERIGATTYGGDASGLVDPCINCGAGPIQTTRGSARTAQRVGLGIRYSTVDGYQRGRARYPIEVSYAHLETVTGDAGLAKQSREQIEIRLFYQLFRR
ncbi:MAG: hypothetical protein LH467_03130 [Gemmatimonadaceae bacterium]|nr:hypothetical protein [Gemmatimonadaceae bacterium]